MTEIDRAIATLVQHKTVWLQIDIPERIDLIHRCIANIERVGADWVTAACTAKGIDPQSNLSGEEWTTGPMATLLYLRALLRTLVAQGQPSPVATRTFQGQTIAKVFPDNLMDWVMWPGYGGEVWIEPGQPATQGLCYGRKPIEGQVALVLGAGNITVINALDILYELFAKDRVVIIKMNPVNSYVGEFLVRSFHPLVDAGFLAVVYGGAMEGSYLCQHPAIDCIHITGSQQTHDSIVWGATSEEQQERKAQQRPLLTKPITSELGSVTPIFVVPGCWSDADLQFQARHVVGMVIHNASFNCIAAQVVVLAKGWPQRATFLNYLRQALAQAAPRQAYYPGAAERYQAFLARYPQAEVLGDSMSTTVPWTLIPDVPPRADEMALRTEMFCGMIAETSLEATTAAEFFSQMVPFANEILWGSLSCVVLIDQATQRRHQEQLARLIGQLRYGGIGVNTWTGLNFMLPVATWGAFPGNSLAAVGSGIGVVHNAYLFDHPQKTVTYAPFRMLVKPIYYAGHRNLLQLAQRYAALQARPSWGRLLQVIVAAFLG